jgi:hypothetical protein
MTKERQRQDTMTRRTFLASASITACIGMSAVGFPMASEQTQSGRVEDTPALLHAAVNLPSGGASIQTYALHRGRCTLVADTLCASVTALAMHPLLPVLYAAGDMVPGQSLPHGNIEVFQIDLNSSRLRSIARVAMSLSATGPRSLTVSPDGTYLLVASASGGIWNAFPLDANGIPAPTPIARKEIGSNAAHPGHAAAHPTRSASSSPQRRKLLSTRAIVLRHPPVLPRLRSARTEAAFSSRTSSFLRSPSGRSKGHLPHHRFSMSLPRRLPRQSLPCLPPHPARLLTPRARRRAAAASTPGNSQIWIRHVST